MVSMMKRTEFSFVVLFEMKNVIFMFWDPLLNLLVLGLLLNNLWLQIVTDLGIREFCDQIQLSKILD